MRQKTDFDLLARKWFDFHGVRQLMTFFSESKQTNNLISNNLFQFIPITYAANLGNLDIVKLLLQFGASKEMKDGNGLTAYDRAENRKHKEVMEFLKEEERKEEEQKKMKEEVIKGKEDHESKKKEEEERKKKEGEEERKRREQEENETRGEERRKREEEERERKEKEEKRKMKEEEERTKKDDEERERREEGEKKRKGEEKRNREEEERRKKEEEEKKRNEEEKSDNNNVEHISDKPNDYDNDYSSKPVEEWSIEDVCSHFKTLGASEEVLKNVREEEIDGEALLELNENYLRNDLNLKLGTLTKHLKWLKYQMREENEIPVTRAEFVKIQDELKALKLSNQNELKAHISSNETNESKPEEKEEKEEKKTYHLQIDGGKMRWKVKIDKEMDISENMPYFLEEVRKEQEIECLEAKGKMKMVMCETVLILEGNSTAFNATTKEDKRTLKELKKEWDEDMKEWQRHYMLLECKEKKEAEKVFEMKMEGWDWWKKEGTMGERMFDILVHSLMKWTGKDRFDIIREMH